MSNSPAVKTILVLAASPVDKARLRLDVEVREMEFGLRRSKYRDKINLESRWAVRIDDLRQALLDVEPQIVHFSGHKDGTAKRNHCTKKHCHSGNGCWENSIRMSPPVTTTWLDSTMTKDGTAKRNHCTKKHWKLQNSA